MTKIRYADLPGGLHIQAVARGKDTIIYLLPGLTAQQRQAALRRARSSGRMGQGPRLSAAGVAGAVVVERIRTTCRNGAAAIRVHPAIFVPPILIIVTAAVACRLLVSASIRIPNRRPASRATRSPPRSRRRLEAGCNTRTPSRDNRPGSGSFMRRRPGGRAVAGTEAPRRAPVRPRLGHGQPLAPAQPHRPPRRHRPRRPRYWTAPARTAPGSGGSGSGGSGPVGHRLGLDLNLLGACLAT